MPLPRSPECFVCGSRDVATRSLGTARVYCKKACVLRHAHERTVIITAHTCRNCENAWEDGSGEFAPLVAAS